MSNSMFQAQCLRLESKGCKLDFDSCEAALRLRSEDSPLDFLHQRPPLPVTLLGPTGVEL